ncbi:hypothetical protein EJ06DRAFT_40393 [Trichodelitschia bisporula]|uniref:RdRP-like PH domain-containing protein n=1 Tax=Trichodelitschia bisporula TaxID=703511 RepID=A0A6G1HVR9_9PEZI|nr:hypothetical protein EJ06DRAFT_40393 [Trichodelitschia bisporula]
MNIFISSIPCQATQEQLGNFLANSLLGIVGIPPTKYDYFKPKNKGIAFLHIQDEKQGIKFLTAVRFLTVAFPGLRHPVRIKKDDFQDNGSRIRGIKEEAALAAKMEGLTVKTADGKSILYSPSRPPSSQFIRYTPAWINNTRTFDTFNLHCGTWEYECESWGFRPFYKDERRGKLLLGKSVATILLYRDYMEVEWEHRLDFQYTNIDGIITARGAIAFNCLNSPKVFRLTEPAELPGSFSPRRNDPGRTKARSPGINSEHAAIAGCCLTYVISLFSAKETNALKGLLATGKEIPSTMSYAILRRPMKSFEDGFTVLDCALSDDGGAFASMPYIVRFQALRFATNGKMGPWMVLDMKSSDTSSSI